MYEPVDLTEQSATNSATGTTMQGELLGHMSALLWTFLFNQCPPHFLPLNRCTCKSEKRPSLGEKKIIKISFLSTSVLRHASILLASPDRSCSAWWEENFASNDYSCFSYPLPWLWFPRKLHPFKPGIVQNWLLCTHCTLFPLVLVFT